MKKLGARETSISGRGCRRRRQRGVRLTASVARANLLIGGVGGVSANVADTRIVKTLVGKVLAVEVLNAPEAAGGDGGLLGALGDGDGAGREGGSGHFGGLGVEGTEDATEERRHALRCSEWDLAKL